MGTKNALEVIQDAQTLHIMCKHDFLTYPNNLRTVACDVFTFMTRTK
jgi:hypothetical protein